MELRSQRVQMGVWAAAILLFGFGDTFTSLLVFQHGGREANTLMGHALAILGPTTWGFLTLKLAATSAIVLVARLQPRMEALVSLAMLFLGLFLVVNNATVLIALAK